MPQMCWGNSTRPNGAFGIRGQGSSPGTITVTPENAATYGFDKIGATINTETGGIVDPFSAPADGLGGRAPRDNGSAVQRLPVAPGYEQIMSQPGAAAFNQRLLSDPQFARNNLNAGYDNPGGENPYGSGLTFTPSGGTSGPAVSRNPLPGTGTNPANRSSTLYNGVTQTVTGGTAPTNITATPLPSSPTLTPAVEQTPDTMAMGTTSQPSQTSTQTEAVFPSFMTRLPGVRTQRPEYQPGSNSVADAMYRRYNRDFWL